MAKRGLILYAHGARDARWAEPFEALRARVAAMSPGLPVALAFLEHLPPNLVQATRELADRGVEEIRLVPLFFGRGGHLREDFPVELEDAKRAAPNVRFEVTVAAGEADAVVDALAAFALDGWPAKPRA
jgi:sirohydrochlorin cobaltochelatase